jgi:thiol-disulfide isomerase/thioredoxin
MEFSPFFLNLSIYTILMYRQHFQYHELSDSEEFSNVVFLKIDVDENPDTAAKYQVRAMPTFLFIKRGEVIDKLMGANPDALQSMLEELA